MFNIDIHELFKIAFLSKLHRNTHILYEHMQCTPWSIPYFLLGGWVSGCVGVCVCVCGGGGGGGGDLSRLHLRCLSLIRSYLVNRLDRAGKHRSYRADSRLAPSQWETALLCTDVSHWLVANLQSALSYICKVMVLLYYTYLSHPTGKQNLGFKGASSITSFSVILLFTQRMGSFRRSLNTSLWEDTSGWITHANFLRMYFVCE